MPFGLLFPKGVGCVIAIYWKDPGIIFYLVRSNDLKNWIGYILTKEFSLVHNAIGRIKVNVYSWLTER